MPGRADRAVLAATRGACLAAGTALLLAGCGGDDGDTAGAAGVVPTPTATAPGTLTTDAATPAPPDTAGDVAGDVTEVDVTIADGQVDPPFRNVEVALGSTLRLTVTSDIADEVHVHGFGEPTLDLQPGVPATLEVVADADGSYEVETHDQGLLLFNLLVR